MRNKPTRHYGRHFLIALSIFLTCLLLQAQFSPAHAKTPDGKDILQFTSGGHILGFSPDSIYLATGTHALKAELVGGKPVSPRAEGGSSIDGHVRPFTRVTYSNVWDGVDIAYEKSKDSLVKPVYTVSAGKSPASIRLRYNHPVSIDEGGNLVVRYDTGRMTESKPVAWQMIEGNRKPVMVAYNRYSEKEVGFAIGDYNKTFALTIECQLIWNTFIGTAGDWDYSGGIAVDSNGDIYVGGQSEMSWGTPVRPWHRNPNGYNWDGWVAKLSGADGTLLWNTFLGGFGSDYATATAIDSSGNLFVGGYSYAYTWGTPVTGYTNGNSADAWIAKLNPANGVLVWVSFFGGSDDDIVNYLAVDPAGNPYAMGYGWGGGSWGTPVNPSPGPMAPWVAKLSGADGTVLWNTYIGGSMMDSGSGLAFDSTGNLYVGGVSMGSWGTPKRPYGGGDIDTFVAKLDPSGNLLWNTFLGGSSYAAGYGIALDSTGAIYLTGSSDTTWGTPVRAYSGDYDAFIAKLDPSGSSLLWNTFLGGTGGDGCIGIALDPAGAANVIGTSYATWGTPASPFNGDVNNFAAGVSQADGTLLWNTFFGSSAGDSPTAMAVDPAGATYASGTSQYTWGTPVNPPPGGGGNSDVFIVKISSRYALSVSKTGTGTGSVASSPSGIDCGTTCSGNFYVGSSVTLTATANAGSTLTGWTGCDSTSGNTCTTAMTSDKFVSARFATDCIYEVASVEKSFSYKGGAFNISVQASGAKSCVSPSVSSAVPWATAAVTSFKNNKGTVKITALKNDLIADRTGIVTIWRNKVNVDQEGAPCALAVSSTGRTFESAGDTQSFTVTATTGCTWSTEVDSTAASWLTATPTGTGTGTVTYTASANGTGKQRKGKITVSLDANDKVKKVFTVTEKK